MLTTVSRRATINDRPTPRVTPSRVDPSRAVPFTLDQELEPFGDWVGEPIWTPPTGAARQLAETMYQKTGWFASDERRWQAVVDTHRDRFTQVREIDLAKASIRLPKGRFFVGVTEKKDFGKIEEEIPACVQTRLEEFLDGPGRRRGVKVYYLKPLCVEVCDHLVLTSREELERALAKVRDEVFAEYHGMASLWRVRDAASAAARAVLAPARAVVGAVADRRQRALDAYQARLEFKRRKTALGAMKNYQKCRTNACTFNEMYALTNPIQQDEVRAHYNAEKRMSRSQRERLLHLAAEAAPGVMSILGMGGLGIGQIIQLTTMAGPPIILCDPAFVAEMPEAPGQLLKIGHFDEVGGVMHVEI